MGVGGGGFGGVGGSQRLLSLNPSTVLVVLLFGLWLLLGCDNKATTMTSFQSFSFDTHEICSV